MSLMLSTLSPATPPPKHAPCSADFHRVGASVIRSTPALSGSGRPHPLAPAPRGSFPSPCLLQWRAPATVLTRRFAARPARARLPDGGGARGEGQGSPPATGQRISLRLLTRTESCIQSQAAHTPMGVPVCFKRMGDGDSESPTSGPAARQWHVTALQSLRRHGRTRPVRP